MDFKRVKCFEVELSTKKITPSLKDLGEIVEHVNGFDKTVRVVAKDFEQAINNAKMVYTKILLANKERLKLEIEQYKAQWTDSRSSPDEFDYKKFEDFNFNNIVVNKCEELKTIYVPINVENESII